MGKRGPKPQPNTTTKPGPIPEPPDFVDNQAALKIWHKYAAPLNALGLLETLDAIAFGMLCDAVAAYTEARDEMRFEQLVISVGEGGALQQHPLVSIVRQQSKAVREFLTEFGMTPGSRSALTGSTSATPQGEDVDPLEALMRQLDTTAATPPAATPSVVTPKKRIAAKKKAAKKAAAKKRTTKQQRKGTK